MTTSRRSFLKTSAVAGSALGLGVLPDASAVAHQASGMRPAAQRAAKPLRILILGGTGFTGPYQVRYAVERGHHVTVFNRGRRQADIPDSVVQLIGDRNGQLDALKGKTWDVVIDVPSTYPRWVRDAATLLKDSAKQYVFISTISVYADTSKPGIDESGPLATMPDPTVEEMRYYGAMKALAEAEAEKAFPGRTTVIRPGLIVGPGDMSDRFSYWPVRIDRGGEILAPGDGTDPVQFIDVRDLAEFIIRMVEQGATGIYNATGPKSPLTMAEMLYGIRAVTTSDVKWTWVPVEFLQEQKVAPWGDMPVWVPGTGASAGFARIDISKALAKGLTFRPLADTAEATLAWYRTQPAERQAALRAGIKPEREAEVLAAWHAREKKS